MTMHLNPIDFYTIPPFTLRWADEMECRLGGMTGEQAVKRSVAGSDWAYSVHVDDELLCFWGIRYITREEGKVSMWLLTTEAVESHKIAFGRAAKKLLGALLTQVSQIDVLVWSKYDLSIKWLENLGFKRHETLTENFIIMRRGK